LDANAVAGRLITGAGERTEMHVTIDRIEVRSPAAAKPAASSKRVRSSSAVSLSDYLKRNGAHP